MRSIIAVHGFGSIPEKTWTIKVKDGDSQRTINWLADKDLLPSKIPNARIMTFNYESTWGPFSNLVQKRSLIARSLNAAILNMRKEVDRFNSMSCFMCLTYLEGTTHLRPSYCLHLP
jgi:hypothetical protein